MGHGPESQSDRSVGALDYRDRAAEKSCVLYGFVTSLLGDCFTKTFCLSVDAGEEEKAAELEKLYGDINALEFYPGLLLEKCQPNSIFGESMVEIGAPFSLKGLFGNPICSPEYWKPSTFGGSTGFEIVKTASLQKLVCLNVRRCPYVAFHVPDPSTETGATGDHQDRKPSTEL